MFLEAEEDFTLPPPPPAQASVRLSESLAEAERHSKAVQRNMWGMVVREKKRLYQEARQKLIETPPEQRPERLSMVSESGEDLVLENLQVPGYLISSGNHHHHEGGGSDENRVRIKLQEERERERERERFRFLHEGDPSRFEVGNITRYNLDLRPVDPEHMPPREYVKVESLNLVRMALMNLEGYAEQLPKVLQDRRTQTAQEIGKYLGERPANQAATTAEPEGGGEGEDASGGDPMDIDND